jgi:hypothetical protein
MQRLASFVFDPYDDSDGRVLRSMISDPLDIPDFVKTASRLTSAQIDGLADDRFALVLLDNGAKLKKYATVDKGNTAMSVMYLLKQAHLLPPEAVKVAASNLIQACSRYGLAVPDHLKLAAASGTSPVSDKSQKQYAKKAKVLSLQYPVKEPEKESTDNPQLGRQDGANADVEGRTNMSGVQGQNFLVFPVVTEKEKLKEAAVTRQQMTKYVDVTSWNPADVVEEERTAPVQTLLGDKYPVDSYDQVKTASVYFEENWRQLHPRDRHTYCVKLASRMTELGMSVPEDVSRYGSETYAADVDTHVASRRSLVLEDFHPALDTLLEKRAHVTPGTFAEALSEFDTVSGVKWLWDAQVMDPWASTFGPSMEKLAKENWTYDNLGVRVHESDLEHLAMNGKHILAKQFGKSFPEEFAKKPRTVFESLPDPNKLILARLAMARHDGTATE